MDKNKFDVVIIGGGISGLACALELKDKGNDSFVVLEARDRVGGRTLSEVASEVGNNCKVDVGGAYLGPDQDFAFSLVKRFGLTLFKINHEGLSVFMDSGRRKTYTGTIPPLSIFALLDLNGLVTTRFRFFFRFN